MSKLVYGVIGLRYTEGLDFRNYDYIKSVLSNHQADMRSLVSGGARGIETLTERWTIEIGMPFTKIKPPVKMFAEHIPTDNLVIEAAFNTRNSEILGLVDRLIVFWNGKEHMVLAAVANANKAKKPVYVYPII